MPNEAASVNSEVTLVNLFVCTCVCVRARVFLQLFACVFVGLFVGVFICWRDFVGVLGCAC
jgi:hypothetical protein